MRRADVERAYLNWLKHTSDPLVKLEIARLAAGAFDGEEEYPSDEVIEVLGAKGNWAELARLQKKFGAFRVNTKPAPDYDDYSEEASA